MTLLITVFAAIISTIVWILTEKKTDLKLPALMFPYWGASLMWLVDAFFEYKEMGMEYFTPALEDMINDAFLGFSVVALGLMIWLAVLITARMREKLAERNQ